MDAIIHIGLNKAGSSTIQAWMASNAPALARAGITSARQRFMPEGPHYQSQHIELLLGAAAHHDASVLTPVLRENLGLTDQAAIDAAARKYADFLRQRLKDRDTKCCVMSSEFLSARLNTVAKVVALDSWLKELFQNVRYILYLRRPTDWLCSRYAQMITRGGTLTLSEFIRDAADTRMDQAIRNWQSGVGADRLDVRLLEPDFLVGGDLIADFADRIGASDIATARLPNRNESLDAAALEVMRVHNLMAARTGQTSVGLIPRGRLLKLLRSSGQGATPLRLDADLHALVETRNAVGLDWIKRTCFPERAQLFAREDTPAVTANSLAEDALIRAVALLAPRSATGMTARLTSRLKGVWHRQNHG